MVLLVKVWVGSPLPSSTVEGTLLFQVVDEAKLVGIHPFLHCLSIRVGFSVPPLDVVPCYVGLVGDL